MDRKMRAANLHAIGDLRYEEIAIPQCETDEVLVEIKSCGICGSDIGRVYTKGTYHFPTVIGHEFSGVVIEDAENKLTGQRVVIFPLLPCFSCESCKSECYATCENYDYYGSRRDGGMAEYIAVKRFNLLMLPENLTYDEGAMCEPVSVARHAMCKLNIQPGENVFISGAGPIGLLAGMWAKVFGAKDVYYIDIDASKLTFAQQMGFRIYNENAAIDCALEGTGHSDALKACLEAVRPQGRLVFMGNPGGDIHMSQNTYWHILRKELKIEGTWNSAYGSTQNDWKESLAAMAEGKIDVKPLITHRFPLSDCHSAFELMKNRSEFYNKVMLTMNEEAQK